MVSTVPRPEGIAASRLAPCGFKFSVIGAKSEPPKINIFIDLFIYISPLLFPKFDLILFI